MLLYCAANGNVIFPYQLKVRHVGDHVIPFVNTMIFTLAVDQGAGEPTCLYRLFSGCPVYVGIYQLHVMYTDLRPLSTPDCAPDDHQRTAAAFCWFSSPPDHGRLGHP